MVEIAKPAAELRSGSGTGRRRLVGFAPRRHWL